MDNQTNPPSLEELEARIGKLEDQVKHPPKDTWDKLGAISGLASGVLVALIGFYATNLYDRHSKRAEESDRCPSSGNLRLIRRFAKGGSGSSGVRV
jgi:hypothetical protein